MTDKVKAYHDILLSELEDLDKAIDNPSTEDALPIIKDVLRHINRSYKAAYDFVRLFNGKDTGEIEVSEGVTVYDVLHEANMDYGLCRFLKFYRQENRSIRVARIVATIEKELIPKVFVKTDNLSNWWKGNVGINWNSSIEDTLKSLGLRMDLILHLDKVLDTYKPLDSNAMPKLCNTVVDIDCFNMHVSNMERVLHIIYYHLERLEFEKLRAMVNYECGWANPFKYFIELYDEETWKSKSPKLYEHLCKYQDDTSLEYLLSNVLFENNAHETYTLCNVLRVHTKEVHALNRDWE